MVSSVAEGEDKPLKYPLMFRSADVVLINKIDLMPHLDFDLDLFLSNLDQVHPGVERMLVSARSGAGVDAWRAWLTAAGRGEGPARHDHEHDGHSHSHEHNGHDHEHADGTVHSHDHGGGHH
jgi:hydrogenase nickel incorporation protein HypB